MKFPVLSPVKRVLLIVLSFCFVAVALAQQADPIPDKLLKAYKTFDIEMARFQGQDRRQLLKSAYGLADTISQTIIGQDHIGRLMQARLVQYLESLGSRTGEPIALHQIGVPGIGKSAILKVLAGVGIPMLRIDAQDYAATDKPEEVKNQLYYLLREALKAQTSGGQIKPFILLVDELDKAPEVRPDGGYVTQPLIGMLNQILVDGKIPPPSGVGATLDLSNVFVVTAMNLSPKDLQVFVREVLKGKEKNFWDFTEKDLKALDEWLRPANQSPAALAKVLSRFFRDNTISRLIPDAVVAKPLYGSDFDKIIQLDIEYAYSRFAGADNAKSLHVAYTMAYKDFLRKTTVFAPSGARMNVKAAEMLTEQLLGYAIRIPAPGQSPKKDPTMRRPRHVVVNFDAKNSQAILTITPLMKKGVKTVSGTPFSVKIPFDALTRSFNPPKELALDIPLPSDAEEKLGRLKRVSTGEILAKRFPAPSQTSQGLASQLNQVIFGQEALSRAIEESMSSYLSTYGAAAKLNYEILAGFTGIGKTQLVYEVAEALGLDVIKFNLQDYSDNNASSAESFASNLANRLQQYRQANPGKPYILLFEELDKINEIDPKTGAVIDRPVISHIKDLLNEGHKEVVIQQGFAKAPVDIDIRDSFLFITMNLPTGLFGFHADPRLTTHRDMERAYESISTSQDELRKALTRMFREETVDRLISPRFHIAKPLEEDHYRQILDVEVERLIETRFQDDSGLRNTAAIQLHLTSRFREEYMMREAVIPSEGGRQAAEAFRAQLQAQVDKAIGAIPRSSLLAKVPFDLYLDFLPRSARKPPRIIATAKYKDRAGKPQTTRLVEDEVPLRFPLPTAFGNIPPERLVISVHEFGHAFTAALLGVRFEWITVVPPSSTIGGLVKYPHSEIQESSARQLIGRLYSGLGSRAMERIFLSSDPVSERSVLDITAGPAGDIQHVTENLYNLLYSLGFDPKGGTIYRSGLNEGNYNDRPEFFSELPPEEVTRLGILLRDVENQLVRYLLAAHPREWYREKIIQLARSGGMSEEDFYKLIEYKYPGEGTQPVGESSSLNVVFKDVMAEDSNDMKRAKDQRKGSELKTAEENLKAAVDAFADYLEKTKPASSSGSDRDSRAMSTSDSDCVTLLNQI